MSLELITAATAQPLSTQDAVDHLRVGDDPEDLALIDSLIPAVTSHVDGRDGWLGRQLITATWEYYLDEFPTADFIRLPLPPIQSITTLKYIDVDGVEQTLSSGDSDSGWQLSKDLSWKPRLELKHNMSWPSTRSERDAVRIRYVAGYGDAKSDVPMAIRQALLLIIGHFYENREAVIVGDRGAMIQQMPMAVEALLTPYRVW